MSKETFLAELYDEAVVRLTENADMWKGLLSTISRYYKYSFDNAVLVHMQRPDAGLLATMDIWNKSIGRWVNKGAKAIAVIDMESPKVSLKYLFDIMDTHGDHESFRKVMSLVWDLEDQYKPELMTGLHNKYHISTLSIESCIYELIESFAADRVIKYLDGFEMGHESSILYGVPSEAVKYEMKQLIKSSVGYVVFQKCGLSTDAFAEDFANISHYNNKELFMLVGSCIISVARPVLREIYQEIQSIKAERSKAYEERTTFQSFLPKRQGWNVISDVERSTGYSGNGDNEIRSDMESIYDGTVPPPAEPVGIGRKLDQDHAGVGAPSGDLQGADDTGALEKAAVSGIPESVGESGTYGNVVGYGRRDHSARDRIEDTVSEVSVSKKAVTEEAVNEKAVNEKAKGTDEPGAEEAPKAARDEEKQSIAQEVRQEPSVEQNPTGGFSIEKTISQDDEEKFGRPNFDNILPDVKGDYQLSLFNKKAEEPLEYLDTDDCDNVITAENVVDITKINYRYLPVHNLYEGGAKAKCHNNIAAIRLLKSLELENRYATDEDQITLAKYVGWGGLTRALTPGEGGRSAKDASYEKEFMELKELLTEEEFLSALNSTVTAYYTDQMIIEKIYQAIGSFGFQGGNILDPAMGVGNFFSMLPEAISGSPENPVSRVNLHGVELDSISGRIAKYLYPQAVIEVRGFEETTYPDHFFDLAIGNIPFNDLHIRDVRYDRYNPKIHDYFFMKALDKVRSGGIIAFITTKGTLDKKGSTIRKYIAARAELIGAIRLPNSAFRRIAGTDATADIVFLQKREREIIPNEENSSWINIGMTENGVPINSYFLEHPNMLLGKMVFDESRYGNEKSTACIPNEGDILEERLEEAIGQLHAVYADAVSEYEGEKETMEESIPAYSTVKNFSYLLIEGEIYYRENSRMYRQNITGKKAERIRGMIEICQELRAIIDFQTDDFNREYIGQEKYDMTLQEYITDLNTAYDRFVEKYGYLNENANVIAFAKDSSAPLLRSIEQERDEEKGIYDKTAVFYQPTIFKRNMPKTAENAKDALQICLNMRGKVDIPFMVSIYQPPSGKKVTEEEMITELAERIYLDPVLYLEENPYIGWVCAEEYLSGYVKDKLAEAVLASENCPDLFIRNVEALKLVQPTPLTPQEISFSLGTTWIPVEIYEKFMYETFKTSWFNRDAGGIGIEFSPYMGAYHIRNKGREKNSVTATKTYGTDRINAYEILEVTLNLKSVEVKDRVEYVDENGEEKIKYVLNKPETILAREKQAEIRLAFEKWLFLEEDRSKDLTTLYNNRFNNIRPREYDGSELILPDLADDIVLRKHQLDVIAHGIYSEGNLLIAHEVGAGKSATRS